MSTTKYNKNEQYYKRSYLLESLILLMIATMMVVAFWDGIFVVVPAGHKGVLFKTLRGGTELDDHYDEGLNVIFPWDKLIIYDTRVQEGGQSIHGLTRDGLSVMADISFRFRPEADSLGLIHKNIGIDYKNTVMIPHISAATRDVVSRYQVDQLFSVLRDSIQVDMLRGVRAQLDANYPLQTLDVIIRDITIDSTVEQSIARKLVEEQNMVAYDYIIQKELKEEERRIIEARGIKAFLDTSTIDILKWEGINATKDLSTSPNAKVVIMGNDSGNLPVILGGN